VEWSDPTLPDGLPTGAAVVTTAGLLPPRWVIHTVGPVWAKAIDHSDRLAPCYVESLRVADELDALQVTFPAVSAGVYGWPMDDAARIAVETVAATSTGVQMATFVLFDARALDAFEGALTRLS